MISVIVCTRNRDQLLDDCIESLLHQETSFNYEIIIVDNNSTDNTRKVVEEYISRYPVISYYLEKNMGLSYARNTGYRKAKYNWIAYVDDDAKAHNNFVEVACKTIQNQDFDCFGGIYNPWFKYGKPEWLPKNFGSNRDRMPLKMTYLQRKCFSGGVAVYRRDLLEAVGGFPVDLGMKGDTIAYGEENYVQEKARKLGFTTGFNPDLQIDHLVRKDKLYKEWHYADAYEKGATEAKLQETPEINKHILKYGILELFKYPIRGIIRRSFFIGNRNILYYRGYFDKIFEMKRNLKRH